MFACPLQNDTIEVNMRNVKDYNEVNMRAKWEVTTHEKIEAARKGKRVSQLQGQAEARLLARKRQLAGVLNAEMDAWQKEFSELGETPQEVKAGFQARAIALRDEREAERRAFVDSMYKLQWQNSCDDGRLLNSKATIGRVMADREEQLRQKAAIGEKLAADDEAISKNWKERIDQLEKKEDAKDAYRAQMEKEIKGMLDTQVTEHLQRKDALKERQAQDAAEELREWRAAKDKEDAKEAARYTEARARGLETLKFNETRLGARGTVVEAQRADDLQLLNYALAKEREARGAEQAKKNDEKTTTKRYQEYLRMQMIKNAQDMSEVDAVRQAAEDRIWKAREQEQQDRVDKRNALWQSVDKSRQAQMALKAERDAKELADYLAPPSDYQAELDAVAAKKESDAMQARLDNQRALLAQKGYKKKAAAREEQEKYLESKVMQKVEAEHKFRLTQMSGTVKTHFPNKHTQWYT